MYSIDIYNDGGRWNPCRRTPYRWTHYDIIEDREIYPIIIPDTQRTVALWTVHTAEPLYIGTGLLHYGQIQNFSCGRPARCYVVEYGELSGEVGYQLIDYAYQRQCTTDPLECLVQISMSHLSPKYGLIRSLVIGETYLQLLPRTVSFNSIEYGPTHKWQGWFEKFTTVSKETNCVEKQSRCS